MDGRHFVAQQMGLYGSRKHHAFDPYLDAVHVSQTGMVLKQVVPCSTFEVWPLRSQPLSSEGKLPQVE